MMGKERNMHKKPKVLCVGADLTTNGGIASVIKCYHHEWIACPSDFDFCFIKTSYYKDKPAYCEPFVFLRALGLILFHLTFGNVALVHVHTSFRWSFARKSIVVLLSSMFRKHIILHFHASRFYEFFITDNRLLQWFIGKILGHCDLTLVLCRDWEEKLSKRFPFANIAVLENPFNRNDKMPAAVSCYPAFTVLFIGFLIAAKGIEDFIEVAKMAAADGMKDIRFIIAGKGDLERYVVDSIARDSLESYVEYVGWVEGEQKRELQSSASLFFLPSYNEGMPMSILEAMNHGLSILASRISGVPDLVTDGENGYLFQPGDLNGFYSAIKKLYFDRPLLEQLGRKSKERSRQFASDVVYGKLLCIYSQVTDGRIGSRPWSN